jgi:hypothetical protein
MSRVVRRLHNAGENEGSQDGGRPGSHNHDKTLLCTRGLGFQAGSSTSIDAELQQMRATMAGNTICIHPAAP